jgi:hypothetical protein
MSPQDVLRMIESDPAAMRVLRAAAGLGLPDWWIGAGFVRNRVWDAISNVPASPERSSVAEPASVRRAPRKQRAIRFALPSAGR